MWAILKRQSMAVWYVTDFDDGRIVSERTPALGRVEDHALEVARVVRERVEFGHFVTVEFAGERLHAANFAEGSVVLLPSRKANHLTVKASMRRWPGDEMLQESIQGFDSVRPTAKVAAATEVGQGAEATASPDAAFEDGPEDGLEETTRAGGYDGLEFDSFAEETVMGPSSYSPEENSAETRVMACTWIQIVEHFGRIGDAIESEFELAAIEEVFESISSRLGDYLQVKSGEFTTAAPSERLSRADAEAVDGTYRRWLVEVESRVEGELAERVPTLEATPWRGLLLERDAPTEPISFSV